MPEYSYFCEGCNFDWSIVCDRSEYKDSQHCPKCNSPEKAHRNFAEDQVHGSVNLSLSEVETLGHYADKQAKKYGKWKCEDMAESFKTRKVDPARDLPKGMTRTKRPDGAPIWPGTTGKQKKRKRNE